MSAIAALWNPLTPAQIAARLGSSAISFKDSLFSLKDDGDATKVGQFQLSGLTTATTRTWTMPDANTTLAGLSVAQTFTAAQTFFTTTSPAVVVQGAAATLGASPDQRFQFTSDADAALSYFIFNHDNMGLLFDCYFNGTNHIASNATAYQLYKTAGVLTVQGYSGLTKGNSFAFGNRSISIGNNSSAATSSLTGTLIVGDASTAATNVGIGGGRVNIGSTIASTSTSTGALQVAGGVGVAGSIYSGGSVSSFGPGGTGTALVRINGGSSGTGGGPALYLDANGATRAAIGFYSSVIGGAYTDTLVLYAVNGIGLTANGSSTAQLSIATSGNVSVTTTTASTSTTTGALVVAGGVGIGGNVTVDGSTGKSIRVTNPVANAAVAVVLGGVGPTGSTAGNPQGWLRISVAGTDRYMPFW